MGIPAKLTTRDKCLLPAQADPVSLGFVVFLHLGFRKKIRRKKISTNVSLGSYGDSDPLVIARSDEVKVTGYKIRSFKPSLKLVTAVKQNFMTFSLALPSLVLLVEAITFIENKQWNRSSSTNVKKLICVVKLIIQHNASYLTTLLSIKATSFQNNTNFITTNNTFQEFPPCVNSLYHTFMILKLLSQG